MRFAKFFQIAVLVALAGGVGPAYSAFWQWSKTSGTNASADPTINWAEGMSPSSVNDSARAMMARAAEYRDDISGLITTGGSSTAYTLTTNQGLSSTPNDGQLIAFTPNVTNGIAPTLQSDGGTAYPIQTSPGVAVGAATLIAGTPYTAKFSVTNSAWILRDFYGQAFSVPLGAFLESTLSTPPNANFILPAGQCISTTTYATYWTSLGSPASGGCPGGQFAVIDMRGRFAVALDNLNGTPANRMTSASTGCGTAMTTLGATCANGAEGAIIPIGQLPSITSVNVAQSISVGPGSIHVPFSTANYSNVALANTAGSVNIPFSTNSSGDLTGNSAFSGTNSISVTSQGTSGTARPQIPPTIGVYKFLRVI